MKYGIQRIDDINKSMTTMDCSTTEQKKIFFNAVQNPTSKVSDYINKQITIKDVYMEQAEYEGDEGVTKGVKTVIITPDGEGILANSMGVARALYGIFDIFGMPSEWDEPMTVMVKQVETPKGRYFKFEVC